MAESLRTPGDLSFDIAGAPMKLALAVPFETPVLGHRHAKAWSLKGNRMVLYWTDVEGAHPIPGVGLDLSLATIFVEAWLTTVDYGPAPDTDGSVEKSSRVYCESWGQIDGRWESFVAIEPYWIVYGK